MTKQAPETQSSLTLTALLMDYLMISLLIDAGALVLSGVAAVAAELS